MPPVLAGAALEGRPAAAAPDGDAGGAGGAGDDVTGSAAGMSTGEAADAAAAGAPVACAPAGPRAQADRAGDSSTASAAAPATARRAHRVGGRRRRGWRTGTTHSIYRMPASSRTFRPRQRFLGSIGSIGSLAVVVAAMCLVGVAGCGGGGPAAAGTSGPATGASSAPAVPEAGTTGTTSGSSTPEADSVEALPPALRQRMTGVSWRSGCPVGLDDLRLLHLSYVDFDGATRRGELVVHKAIADATVRVFQRLRQARFPIRSMTLIEAYNGSDDASMAADNTSGFNCRNVPGTTHWSKHAYGRAVDVNTVENPYLPRGQVMPPAGRSYLDRRDVRPGMILAGDATVRAFTDEGFAWGGMFRSGVDYQHFEKT